LKDQQFRAPRCFLTPPKFQGRNPTIPTDRRLDSGWATGPPICLPKEPGSRPAERRPRARSIATSAISTPIVGNRCRQTATFAATASEARHRAREFATTTPLVVLAVMAGEGVVGLNCRPLGRIQIGAARNRGWDGKGLFAADGGGVDCAGPRPLLGRSRSRLLGRADRWPGSPTRIQPPVGRNGRIPSLEFWRREKAAGAARGGFPAGRITSFPFLC